MSRAKKLLIVSFVLALGVGLAWPFRRSATELAPAKQNDVPGAIVSLGAVDSSPAPGRRVVAKVASTAENASTVPLQTGFDLENHAALVSQPSDLPSPKTVATGESRAARPANSSNPAYSTNRVALADNAAWPEEIVHVVHNGDTLEKLAERYLGDVGRALELFDLNRDQLANPHLLPIGAELRIPVPPRRELD